MGANMPMYHLHVVPVEARGIRSAETGIMDPSPLEKQYCSSPSTVLFIYVRDCAHACGAFGGNCQTL